MERPERKVYKVLHLDGFRIDSKMFMEACSISHIDIELRSFSDGASAMDYIRTGWVPDLFVSSKMAHFGSGIDLIGEIRASIEPKVLPLVIFTGSASVEDVYDAFVRGCNSYIIKPRIRSEYIDVSGRILSYWLEDCYVD